jgi:SAM-dependent methyltransferase
MERVDPAFYDEAYYRDGSKSNYAPYAAGAWVDWIIEMLMAHIERPRSVLDIGCAFGFVVERLWKLGIPAWGFDISEYAVEVRGSSRTWVGDAADPGSWRRVDLALATELAEHLTPAQSRTMLRLAYHYSGRFLLLIAAGEPDPAERDLSHINVVPMSWWEQEARKVGWTVSDASAFNDDWRSSQMSWQGRWLLLTKED